MQGQPWGAASYRGARLAAPYVAARLGAAAVRGLTGAAAGYAASAARGYMAGRAAAARPYRRRGRKLLKGRKKTLKKLVKELKKVVASDQAYHTYKLRATTRALTNAVNLCGYASAGGITSTVLELAMAGLRYYDPATPGTLVTADASTGTYTREIHFSGVHNKITVRNNYQSECKCTIYLCLVKADTSVTPTTAFSNGITDLVQGSSPTLNTPLLYLTDIELFNALWTVKKSHTRLLQPGLSYSIGYNLPSFDYRPDVTDAHSLTYLRCFHGSVFIIRVEGTLHHDSSANEQGTGLAGVDVESRLIFKMTYDAGTNLNDISFLDQANSFTNGALQSCKPVSDNLTYSVT